MNRAIAFLLLLSLTSIACDENRSSTKIPPTDIGSDVVEEKFGFYGYWQNANGDVVFIEGEKNSNSQKVEARAYMPSVIFEADQMAIVPNRRISLQSKDISELTGTLKFDKGDSANIEKVEFTATKISLKEIQITYLVNFRDTRTTLISSPFKRLNVFEGQYLYRRQFERISPTFASEYFRNIHRDKGACT